MNSTDFDQVLAMPLQAMAFQSVTLEQLDALPDPPNCDEIPPMGSAQAVFDGPIVMTF